MDKDNSIKNSEGKSGVNLSNRRMGIIYTCSSHLEDSTTAQDKLCSDFCGQNNIAPVMLVINPTGVSCGGLFPVLRYCWEHKNEVDVLVVTSRDRLGTNTAEYLRCKIALLEEGVEILTVTDAESVDTSLDEMCVILGAYEHNLMEWQLNNNIQDKLVSDHHIDRSIRVIEHRV